MPELERLRLSSIDSIEADADLLDAIAKEPRLMPHLHLSLQSGDDMILKRMKRRHFARDAIRFCAHVRRLRPDIVFGADIIAGFPTENETMFARSLDIVDECGLTHLHVFPFSPRPGTPAARMPQVSRALVKERARRLRREGRGGAPRAISTRNRRTPQRSGRNDPARAHRRFHPGAVRLRGHSGRGQVRDYCGPRRGSTARGLTGPLLQGLLAEDAAEV